MAVNKRFPTRYTVLAGLAGAIAWGLPYPMSPFMRFLPLVNRIPDYKSPPFTVDLANFITSYALAGILAGGLFLLGLRSLRIDWARFSRPALTLPLVLSTLAGLAVGGAFAIFFGLVTAVSPNGYHLAISIGFDSEPEPYLSIGLVLGSALTTLIICLYSGILKPPVPATGALFRLALKIALQVSGWALLVRVIAYLIEYSSMVVYTIGKSIPIFMLFQVAAGALFGILIWLYCSKLKPA